MNSILDNEDLQYWQTQARLTRLKELQEKYKPLPKFPPGGLLNRALAVVGEHGMEVIKHADGRVSDVGDHTQDAVRYLAKGLVINPDDLITWHNGLYKKGDIVEFNGKTYRCER